MTRKVKGRLLIAAAVSGLLGLTPSLLTPSDGGLREGMPIVIDIPMRLLMMPGLLAATPVAFTGIRGSNVHNFEPLWGLMVAMNVGFYFALTVGWFWLRARARRVGRP